MPADECSVEGEGPHFGPRHEWVITVAGETCKIIFCETHETKYVAPAARVAQVDCTCRLCAKLGKGDDRAGSGTRMEEA